jgi:hypothetical protein
VRKCHGSWRSQAKILRGALEGLFHDHGVDLYFSGHEHVYEHFARIYQGKRCTATTGGKKCGLSGPCPCTAHIVVGNAGNIEFPYGNHTLQKLTHYKNSSIEAFQSPQPSWEHFRSKFPSGFGLLDVHNRSVMVWRQINARTGATIDSHVFRRGQL